MQFPRLLGKIATHPYTLYVMVFLAATNVIGYLVAGNLAAVSLFALAAFLASQFSKNMAVVLLVGLVASSWLALLGVREGMETATAGDGDQDQDQDGLESEALKKAVATDPQLAAAVPRVRRAKNRADLDAEAIGSSAAATAKENAKAMAATAKAALTTAADEEDPGMLDTNNTDLNRRPRDPSAPAGAGTGNVKRRAKTEEHFGPRLDYASTIESSYKNLDEMLGSDSIRQLTKDTQKLMAQQQNLFNTMTQMVPVLDGAQKMLNKFDMTGLTKSFEHIKGLSGTQ